MQETSQTIYPLFLQAGGAVGETVTSQVPQKGDLVTRYPDGARFIVQAVRKDGLEVSAE